MSDASIHISVMPDEVLSHLAASRGGRFLDCTLGGAGHSQLILEAHPENRLTAIDRDARAIQRAQTKLAAHAARVTFFHGSFADLPELLKGQHFDGILADLGVSTDQLKENRGFSFNDSAPLDMRMDQSQEFSAAELVNTSAEKDLYVLLRQGGVGPEALQVARAIVDARPIESTEELAKLVNQSLARFGSGKAARKKVNPATVVFQALRMAVNSELPQIESLMGFVPHVARSGSRFVVLTFHSLEDKAVQRQMREWESGGEFSAQWPGARSGKKLGRVLAKKPVVASDNEISKNPSARSARLRAFEFA